MKTQGISPNQLRGMWNTFLIFTQQVATSGLNTDMLVPCYFRFCFHCQIKVEGSASS